MLQLNDGHCHFLSAGFFDALGRQHDWPARGRAARVVRALGWDAPGEPRALAARWVRELDRHRVSRAALIASVPGDESSVVEATEAFPDRFVGLFMLDPTARGAIARVKRVLATPGMRGVCLYPAMHGFATHDPIVDRVADAVAARAGTALFVHCGMLSIGVRQRLGLPSRFEARLGNPLGLQAIATNHPTLPVIVPHFGAGLLREALMLADGCANVVLDTSSSNRWTAYHPGLALEDVFRQALAVAGPERLIFGTDSSFFPRGWQQPVFRTQRRLVRALRAGPGVERAIFGGNFDRIFPAR